MTERTEPLLAFGRALRDARTERGMSQQDLAARVGLHRTYIGGVERGERNPSYTSLVRIADAVGEPLSDLVERAERNGG